VVEEELDLQAIKWAKFWDKPFQAPPAIIKTEPIMTVILLPNRVQRKSPINEQKIAGKNNDAVMIPRRLPVGVPK
jgi:hypothetical protein